MAIIDGKVISEEIKQEAIAAVEKIMKNGGAAPSLAVIIVGENPASKIYVRNKRKICEYVGIKSQTYELPEETPEDELIALINSLNESAAVNGILVQLPLPRHIDENKVLLTIRHDKDVDGFHPYNVGLLSIGRPALSPCTPAGVIEMLKRSGVEIAGKSCVVVGRSNIVGKPVSYMLTAENGTVTLCHSKTPNLAEVCGSADILVSAVGKAGFVTADMVKRGAVIIDVGMNKDADGKTCGDVDFPACSEKASLITPVPGGVGLMTTAMLMKNCISCYLLQNPPKS